MPLLAAAFNLNGPGEYLHWSIFEVSLANLVLVGVMVVIFALASSYPSLTGVTTTPARQPTAVALPSPTTRLAATEPPLLSLVSLMSGQTTARRATRLGRAP